MTNMAGPQRGASAETMTQRNANNSMGRLLTMLAALGAISSHATASLPDPADNYTVLLAGLPKGEMTVATTESGERRITFQYQDRGRGPELTVVRRDDAQGIPQSLTVSGL